MAKEVEPKEADLLLPEDAEDKEAELMLPEDDDVMLEGCPSEFNITIKDLRKLDISSLKSILQSCEIAFITIARDTEPDIKGMRDLRIQMKRVHKTILWKLDKAAVEDNKDYRELIKLTKAGDVDKREELIKKILG